jgi:hypothetical protein
VHMAWGLMYASVVWFVIAGAVMSTQSGVFLEDLQCMGHHSPTWAMAGEACGRGGSEVQTNASTVNVRGNSMVTCRYGRAQWGGRGQRG